MENNKNLVIKRIAKNAIVMALYVALTFASYPISFGMIQFRLSEVLVLLCFFNPDYIIGITLGTFLTNLASPMFPIDLLIGTAASLLSCFAVSYSKHLIVAAIFPIFFNSFLVGLELFYFTENTLPYWVNVGYVCLGEFVMMVVGYLLIYFIFKNKKMLDIINAKNNRDFKF